MFIMILLLFIVIGETWMDSSLYNSEIAITRQNCSIWLKVLSFFLIEFVFSMLSQINCNNKGILTNGKNFKQICKKRFSLF